MERYDYSNVLAIDRPEIATYRRTSGNAVELYNDGAAGPDGNGLLSAIARSIRDARHFIFIAGWSVHPFMRLEPEGQPLGEILVRKALDNRNLIIAIHAWSHTVGAGDTINDALVLHMRQIADDLSGGRVPRAPFAFDPLPNLLVRLSSRTGEGGAPGFGWSHHQKIVVTDEPTATGRRRLAAYLGGIDLTMGRFDWSSHAILAPGDGSPDDRALQRLRTSTVTIGDRSYAYDDWYSAEFADSSARLDLPRQPWHDIHCKVDGPVAWDVVREFVGRWNRLPAFGDGPNEAPRDLAPGAIGLGDNFPPEDDQGVPYPHRQLALQIYVIQRAFLRLFEDDFVQREESVRRGPWQAQIYRSLVRKHWESQIPNRRIEKFVASRDVRRRLASAFAWNVRIPEPSFEASIQEAYLRGIGAAQRFIYIESQYLIGSGHGWTPPRGNPGEVTNRLPQAIVNRILEFGRDRPFHVYVVFPLWPEGSPTNWVIRTQRHFQRQTIEYMLRTLWHGTRDIDGLGERWTDKLSFYFLAQWGEGGDTVEQRARERNLQRSRRYMIYVHSKLMICDDTYLVLGSANLNERSLNGGRDSEICVGLWPGDSVEACQTQLMGFRQGVWAEHLGRPGARSADEALDDFPYWRTPEDPRCVAAVTSATQRNYDNFHDNTRRRTSGHLCRWPLGYDGFNLWLYDRNPLTGYLHEILPDAPRRSVLAAYRAAVESSRDNRDPERLRRNDWAVFPPPDPVITLLDVAE